MRNLRVRGRLLCLWMLVLLGAGCATMPYRQGIDFEDPRLPEEGLGEVQVVRGRPNRVLDKADWIWPLSWLRKVMLWDRRVDSHQIGEETEEVIRRYLAYNELEHVKVRLNQYAPGGEFRRIVDNKSVGAGWRYTVGMLSWLRYTLLPGRVFGGDHYNPYSNTVNLYSDIPAIAVHEGGHGKDFADRKWKGTYAVLYMIPFLNLHHELVATNDALGYLREEEPMELEQEGFRIMHPAYGTYVGSNLSLVVPERTFMWNVIAVFGGHMTGRYTAARVPEGKAEEKEEASESVEAE